MTYENNITNLSLNKRLSLLREGRLSAREIADAVADFGSENFVEAKADVERLLDHGDEIVRYNAISTLAYEWGTTDRPERVVEMVLNDPDVDCRRNAASALGSLFRSSNDSKILEILANVVLDPAQEDQVRCSAYAALLDVLGVPKQHQPDTFSLKLDAQVDWILVEQCRQTHDPVSLQELAERLIARTAPRDILEDIVKNVREVKNLIKQTQDMAQQSPNREPDSGDLSKKAD